MKDPGVCRAVNLTHLTGGETEAQAQLRSLWEEVQGSPGALPAPGKVDGDPEGSPQEGPNFLPGPSALPSWAPAMAAGVEKDRALLPGSDGRSPVKRVQLLWGSRKVRGTGACVQEPRASGAWMQPGLKP